jgi:streptomycin 6-kinase
VSGVVEPAGTPLGDMEPSTMDPESVCAALRSLVGQPVPATDMPTLTGWLRDRLIDDALTDLAPGQQPAPIAERRAALAILHDLQASGTEGLCHGDASPWNLLLGKDGRTILIDPRGVAGEVEYDLAVTALKFASAMPLAASVPYLARQAGVDHKRVRAWVEVAEVARV